jgi:phosphoglycolate phosphatase-like HAD superfamily hydrolase
VFSLLERSFKAIFFDLDGTLVDLHGPLYIAARNALDQLGQGPPLTPERYREALARDDLYLGLPDHLRPHYLRLAFAYFVTELDRTERLEVLPHVHETLAELKRRGYATAIVTSRPGDSNRLVAKLAMVGLASYFDQVITQSTASLRALDKTESLKHASARATSRATSWRLHRPAMAPRSRWRPVPRPSAISAIIRSIDPTSSSVRWAN